MLAIAALSLVAGCDYCAFHPEDPTCPPPRTTSQLICDRLVECGRFTISDYDVCVRTHDDLGRDPTECLSCVEATECDVIHTECADRC